MTPSCSVAVFSRRSSNVTPSSLSVSVARVGAPLLNSNSRSFSFLIAFCIELALTPDWPATKLSRCISSPPMPRAAAILFVSSRTAAFSKTSFPSAAPYAATATVPAASPFTKVRPTPVESFLTFAVVVSA